MSNLHNIIVLSAVLGLSAAAYAADDAQSSNTAPTAASVLADKTPASTAVPEKNKTTEAVNINAATEKQLAKVKGIGKKKAKAIVEYREKNGEFKAIDDLLNVKARGVSKKWLEKMSGKLAI